VTSDFRPEVKIRPFRACAMHPAIIIGTVIVNVAMRQIPRYTERISSFISFYFIYLFSFVEIPLKKRKCTTNIETVVLRVLCYYFLSTFYSYTYV